MPLTNLRGAAEQKHEEISLSESEGKLAHFVDFSGSHLSDFNAALTFHTQTFIFLSVFIFV